MELLVVVSVFGLIGVQMYTNTHAAVRQNYFVSCHGKDTATGKSPADAWRNPGQVPMTKLNGGDSVFFERGCVWNGGFHVTAKGVPMAPIVFAAYGKGDVPAFINTKDPQGNAVTVSGRYTSWTDFAFRNAHAYGMQLEETADHTIVKNAEVSNVGIGFGLASSSNKVTGANIHDLKMVVNTPQKFNDADDYGAEGFVISAPGNEVSYSKCFNCIAKSEDFGTDGGFASIWNSGDNTYLHHNVARSTDGFINVSADSGGSVKNVRAAYNVLDNTRSAVSVVLGSGVPIDVSGMRFENNTVVSTNKAGRMMLDFPSALLANLTLRNNLFYSDASVAANGGLVHSNNLFFLTGGASLGFKLDPTEKTADPKLISLSFRDLHLAPGSPAVDAGVPLGYNLDLDGNTVPFGPKPDLGAYEKSTGVKTVQPTVAPR